MDTQSKAAPVVATSAGRVRGIRRGTGAAFLGVPFAAPPVGGLRFMAPAPPASWTGIREATEYGPTTDRDAIPDHIMPETVVPGDATLNLNVFTPAVEESRSADEPAGTGVPGGLRPVMVWFHGGGFIGGSPKNLWYEGDAFVRDGVVVVTVDYRLGFDGFGLIPGAPDNRGVLDWLAALQWVQDEIAAFGGDPERVTIAGQSAGGGAVLTLLGMPAAQHLFRAAISLSGALGDQTAARARRVTDRMAGRLHVEADRDGFASVPEARLLEAQKRTLSVNGPASVRRMFDGVLPIGPVVGGDLVPRSTVAGLAAGIGSDKPLLIVACDDEMVGDGDRTLPPVVDRLGHRCALRLAGRDPRRLPRYLAARRSESTRRMLGHLVGDALFRVLVTRVARARRGDRTWVGRMSWRSATFGAAIHCVDLPFFFDVAGSPTAVRLLGEHAPQPIADALHGAALHIIRGEHPGWEPWMTESDRALVFDLPLRVRSDAYADVRELLDRA